MNVQTLQDKLTASREKILTVLGDFPDEVLLRPATIGDWSVAELISHLAIWEAELVTALAEIQRRKKPDRLIRAINNRQKYNKARYAEIAGRDLDAVFNDLQGARIQLEVRLEDLTDKDLNDPRRFRWLRGKPLWPFLAKNSYEHELSHLPALRAFAKRYNQPPQVYSHILLEDVEIGSDDD